MRQDIVIGIHHRHQGAVILAREPGRPFTAEELTQFVVIRNVDLLPALVRRIEADDDRLAGPYCVQVDLAALAARTGASLRRMLDWHDRYDPFSADAPPDVNGLIEDRDNG